ncbi:MAG: hypothetical protein AABZ57_01275 [Candidatus Margulisiibacteriota bacterium]
MNNSNGDIHPSDNIESREIESIKILSDENIRMRGEVVVLKQSLKRIQNSRERLRIKFAKTDKENAVYKYRLHISFLPELLKFSSVSGIAIFGSIIFTSNSSVPIWGVFVCGCVYVLVLYICRN